MLYVVAWELICRIIGPRGRLLLIFLTLWQLWLGIITFRSEKRTLCQVQEVGMRWLLKFEIREWWGVKEGGEEPGS